MTCDLTREELISYLYDETTPAQKSALDTHLAVCPACRQLCAELRRTAALLPAWADEEPPAALVFVPQRQRRRLWPRLGWGAAASLAAALAIWVASHSEVEYQGGQLSWKVGAAPAVDSTQVEPLLTRAEFFQAQRQFLEVVQQSLQANQAQQRQELLQVLAQFARDLEQQRQADLRAVGQGLQAMDWSTENRFLRTEGMLQQLLKTAAWSREGN